MEQGKTETFLHAKNYNEKLFAPSHRKTCRDKRKETSSQETPGFGIGDKLEERKTYEWKDLQKSNKTS